MSESDDSDILADIKALDNALMLNTNNKSSDSWHDIHNDSSSSSVDDSDDSCIENEFYRQSCQDTEFADAYEINKRLIKGLMLAKKKVSTLLQRCEEKIEELNEEIETSKDGSTLHERTRYSIAGTPYFKDKLGFSAPKNADMKLKESRNELSVLHVQKSCRWSGKDRTALLNAICDEVFSSMSTSGFNVEQLSNKTTDNQTGDETTNKGLSKSHSIAANSLAKTTVMIPLNFSEIVRTMNENQIDWMKIAAQNFDNKHSPGECRSMWNVYLHPDINKNDWTNKEDKRLVQHVKQCGYQDWNTIATRLGTKRSAYQCFIRYNTIRGLPTSGRNWTKPEDQHLQLVINKLQIGNYIPWAEVANYMGNRTKQQVYTRWMYRKAPHLMKGRFTYVETQTLLKAVSQYGTDFSKISRHVMPHRTTVQLNGHYQSILQNKANAWTYEDDMKLIKLHKKYGNNWVKIANSFVPKTRTQVRHRYMALQRYTTKGYKIRTIPRSNQPTSLDSKRADGSSSSAHNLQSIRKKIPLLSCNISTDTIQARLFENLSFPLIPGNINSQEIYSAKQLEYATKELYDMLKLLDTNFDLSNMFFDYAHLSKKEKQLFTSLKRYVTAHHCMNNEKRDQIIEMFRCRMFGSETNVTSHFIPPLPFSGYVKRKRQHKTNSINYDSSCKEKYLVDLATDKIIPCNINSFFIGVEEEIQFQKLSQLLIKDNYSCNKQNVNSRASLVYNSSLNEVRTRGTQRLKPNIAKTEICVTKAVQSCKTQESTRVKSIDKNDILNDAITPNHETLLGLKNLMFWKMLHEFQSDQSFPTLKNNTQHQTKIPKSPAFEKAYKALKIRLIRLFKLPLTLSRVMVEMSEQESLFVIEEQKEQLTKKWSEEQAEDNNQAIFANNSILRKTNSKTTNLLTTHS